MLPSIITLIILAISIILLVTEKIPMSVIGLLIIVAVTFTGILPASEAIARFGDSTIVLVSSVFILSAALFEVGVAQKIGQIANRIIKNSKNGEMLIIFIVMATTIVMCAALPHIAVAAAMIPIVISIATQTGVSRTRLLMVMSLTTSFGGTITLIGTPPNMLAKAALEGADAGTFAFFDFAWVGVPCAIIGTIVVLLLYKKLIPAYIVEQPTTQHEVSEEVAVDPVLKRKQIITTVVFIVFILGIIFEKLTGLSSSIIGILCVCVLIVTRVISEKKAYQSINWGTTFFIVGILTLSDAMMSSGASEMLANAAMSILGENPNPLFLTGFVYLLSAALTQFVSNTGAAGLLLPVGLSVALGIGADPRAVVMAIVMGCNSSFLTPMATPANTLIVDDAKLHFTDWLKAGLPLLIVTFILCILILPTIWPFY
ncbi:MAG: SLC13 family permease [Lachnospiraceae bacterium]